MPKCSVCNSNTKFSHITMYGEFICSVCHDYLRVYGSNYDNQKHYNKASFDFSRKGINRAIKTKEAIKNGSLLYEYYLYDYPPDWDLRGELAKRRDHHKCAICSSDTDLIIHHKKTIKERGTHYLNNLTTLCANCHLNYHPEIKEKIEEDEKRKRITICPDHNFSMKKFLIFSWPAMFDFEKEDSKLRRKNNIIYFGSMEYLDDDGKTIKYGYICPKCIEEWGQEKGNRECGEELGHIHIYLLKEGDKCMNEENIYVIYENKLYSINRYPGSCALID